MDLNGNRTGQSVNELFANYMKRDKYTFVGESSSTNIPLRKRILVRANSNKDLIVNPKWYEKWCRTPDFMSSMPLSTSHVEKLAAYCARRKTTIFDFLFNEMRFEPTALSDAEQKKAVLALQPFDMDYAGFGFKYSPRGRMVTGKVLLVAGANEISKNSPGGEKAWLTYKAVNAAKVGAQSSEVTFSKNRIEARGNMYPDESSNNTLLFFLAA